MQYQTGFISEGLAGGFDRMAQWSARDGGTGIAGASFAAGSKYLRSSVHAAGMDWAKQMWGMKPSGFKGKFGIGARVLGPAFLGISAYQGYQEGGMWGATKGVARESAMAYAFGAGLRALNLVGSAALGYGLAAVGIAGGIGATAMAAAGMTVGDLAEPWTREKRRRNAKLEMGMPVIDQFGLGATMRQRSLAALQNSRVNGMGVLGNEAMLNYRLY